uniref:Proheparin-binding EGF-like growth factor n=1 Tax=Leptobrachium leishanense TaxID=445787 RepID=A0A8C5R475_9ANUR
MKFKKLFILILIQVTYIFAHGAIIGSNQNDVFNKGVRDFSAMSEGFLRDEVFSIGNHIIAPPKASPSKTPAITRQDKPQKPKRKGKGRKRDPCQRKYKNFCIHGECRYLKAEKSPSCVCQSGYYGERCHALTLPLENPINSYDQTTILAVVAVVLSSFCLVIISSLLVLRYHKRGVYNVENEEKFKLGIGA